VDDRSWIVASPPLVTIPLPFDGRRRGYTFKSVAAVPNGVSENAPTVSCERCGREWELTYELDELMAGNGAIEQFALDHERHTGHYPDDVSTWRATCRRCPDGVERLSESAARRWARTHARHTRHDVTLRHAESETTLIEG
jgi:hypothetical protein